MRKNDINDFNAKVRVTPGCWEWVGKKSGGGYGSFRSNAGYTAHRYSYSYYIGDIPVGMYICHKCDNPSCVNPDHLFCGSSQENTNDKVSKGRHPKGEDSATAKLSDIVVSEIRSKYIKGSQDFGTRALAKIYNVSHRLIWSIVANKDRLI
jgi:hypothetical protein